MHRIYHSCNACLILPGGLSRLVAIDEETAWIHRAWTLQEAIAPSRCLCLFAWPHGDCTLQAIFFARVAEVEPKTAAMADMRQLLAVNVGYVNTIYYDGPTIENDTRPAKVDVRLLGHRHKDRVPQDALIGAIELKGSTGMGTAIWRAAFTRTSSRPVDFILSIMGLLGVTLDPGQFTENDKLGASIALMRALLENGQRPEWLGIAPNVNPGAELTMLPVFPEPDADGRACYPSSTDGGKSTASEIMGQLTFWFDDLPTDSAMDDEGYLTISALAVSVQSFAHGSHPTFKSTQGVQWVVSPERRSPAYAVLIGKKRYYANGAYPTRKEPFNNVLLLVEEHEPARFRCLGYANVRDEVLGLEGWTTMALRIK
ncbi:hypothetical protein QBC46DRAFT_378867 [Diplogelasinospora grovesii]|uniref:Uncharacterized protein n=1 Tax=Diplogelasinospora grovesii TaxID=303347 RepID=A0AAN6ND08_9PEZI|nr:hypothetical protein QBC46DRAFT_378867 [Diplogelasinospora grovesii]